MPPVHIDYKDGKGTGMLVSATLTETPPFHLFPCAQGIIRVTDMKKRRVVGIPWDDVVDCLVYALKESPDMRRDLRKIIDEIEAQV